LRWKGAALCIFHTKTIPSINEMTDSSAPKQYLAKPSGLCCLSGTLHTGEARGKLETLSTLETYVATPKEENANGNIVLYFPDVYGLFKNGQLILDAFADAGYLALGVDYFRGVSTRAMSCLLPGAASSSRN
jgi:hypothetical protein